MAALAGGKIEAAAVSAERTRTVVARRAVIDRTAIVLRGCDVGHLSSLRSVFSNIVTLAATNALGRGMVVVAENRAEHIPARRRAVVRLELVTRRAGADLGFVGCMASVAVGVRPDADRNALAGAGRIVAESAALGRTAFAAVVSRVVELHIEAFAELCRKDLYGRIGTFEVGMADGAHCACRRDELVEMASDAGVVARKL